jgi:serine/threonine-protein kinase
VSGKQGPSAASELLAELDRLIHAPAGKERSAQVWQVIGRVYGHEEGFVLLDFALEHGLVFSDSKGRGETPRYLVWTNPVDGSEMAWIPAGSFFIGPRQKRHQARSQGFSLARHPVTNNQFARFLEDTGYEPPPAHPDPGLFLSHWQGGTVPEALKQHPVVWVSYLDALAYCDWAGVTLPTEWLWEKAARGPEGPPFPWGDQSPFPPWGKQSPGLANVRSTGTRPIGSFTGTRTAYGCEDMIGNVSEWCRMIEGDDRGRVPEDRPEIRVPTGDVPVYAAVRGSCFLRSSLSRMPAWHRRRLAVTRRNRWVSFRPACFLHVYPT